MSEYSIFLLIIPYPSFIRYYIKIQQKLSECYALHLFLFNFDRHSLFLIASICRHSRNLDLLSFSGFERFYFARGSDCGIFHITGSPFQFLVGSLGSSYFCFELQALSGFDGFGSCNSNLFDHALHGINLP